MNRLDRFILLLIQRSQKVVAIFLCCLGSVVLVGWCVGVRQIHISIRKIGTMQPLTACAFLLGGISLYLWQMSPTQLRTRWARLCGAAVALIGFASVANYILQWGFGWYVRPLVGKEWFEYLFAPQWQMALATAISFSLAGFALCIVESRPFLGQRLEQWFAIGSSLLPFMVFAGHVYGEKRFIKPLGSAASPSSMVLGTAVGLLVLAFGIVTARPQRGWIRYFADKGPVGLIARRLLPAAAVILLGIGALAEIGRRTGVYSGRQEIALVTVLSSFVFGLLIFRCLRTLAEMETSREGAEANLQKSEERLKAALKGARVGAWERDLRTNQVLWSEALEGIFGLEPGSFDGRFESLLQLIHPDDRAMVQARLSRVIQGIDDSYQCEYRVRSPGKPVRWIASRGDIRFDGNGQPIRLAGIIVDVTERKLLERKLIEASNREQRRLGQDLHDDLGQWLTAIHLETRALSMFLKPVNTTGAERAEKIVAWMGEALERTRMLARGMAPAVIETGGLSAALEELTANTEKMFHVCCEYSWDQKLVVRNSESALQLYRIAQEAISNALRHGKASELEVRLHHHSDGRGCLMIRDNGTGVPQPLPKNCGIGLRIMRYRAQLLGADVEIRSAGKKGTEVVCCFSGDL